MTAKELIAILETVAPNTVVLVNSAEYELDDSVDCELRDVEVKHTDKYTFYYEPNVMDQTKEFRSTLVLTKAVVIF